jgi:hypothetical protein
MAFTWNVFQGVTHRSNLGMIQNNSQIQFLRFTEKKTPNELSNIYEVSRDLSNCNNLK